MRLRPVVLTGAAVQLEPLDQAHAARLVAAADRDRSSYGWTNVPADLPAMRAYIDGLLADAEADTALPFAQRRLVDGAVVGCTRFLDVRWWPERDTPAEVEIGGTWLAADAQRSPINTEAKLLLLTHAFDTWHVHRVAICTDARNEASRRAILRIGATFEGVLRNHRQAHGDLAVAGSPRDTAVHSVTADEWPHVRAHLLTLLDRSR